jgi:UDP-3-O-[3-hydroxymyristoyl] glucosamine N-acyltransferase
VLTSSDPRLPAESIAGINGVWGEARPGRGGASGQAGLVDHLEIGDGVMIGAQSGVTRKLPAGQMVSGTPAMPHDTWLRAHVLMARLPELRQQLRALAERVRALESRERPARKAPRRRA